MSAFNDEKIEIVISYGLDGSAIHAILISLKKTFLWVKQNVVDNSKRFSNLENSKR